MRLRPIEPPWFSHFASVFVVLFVLQLATLLFVGVIAPRLKVESPVFSIVANDDPEFRMTLPGLLFRADRPSPTELKRYRPLLLRELARYSPAIVDSRLLRQIVVCSRLTANGRPQGGFALGPAGTIWLDVSPDKLIDDVLLRRAIHHEIFHVIDVGLMETPGAAERWAKLNPPSFVYGGDEILQALELTN